MVTSATTTMSLADAYRTAVDYQQAGDLDGATRYYEAILRSHPGHPDTVHNLGIIARRRGHLDRAAALLRESVSLAPTNANFCSSLSATLERLGDLDSAAYWGRKAIALNPGQPHPYTNLGYMRYEQGDETALPLLSRAVKISPAFADAQRNLMLARFWAAATENWAAVSREFDVLAACSANDAYELRIRESIGWWTAGDLVALEHALDACGPLAAKMSGALSHTLKPTRAYEIFLRELLRLTVKGGAAPSPAKPLSIIGDSHCLSYAHTAVSIGGETYRAAPRLIMGCKAWHLAAPGANRYKWRLGEMLRQEQSGGLVLVSIGEIDCRSDEGILTALDRYNGSMAEAVEHTVRGFVDTMMASARSASVDAAFLAVPAPVAGGASVDRRALIRMFNYALAREARRAGAHFVDLYSLTVGPDGAASQSFHIDGTHLAPFALQQAIDASEDGRGFGCDQGA